MTKLALANILGAIAAVMLFDLVAYLFLPTQHALQFHHYRQIPRLDGMPQNAFPNDYFVPHAERGFDIGRNRSGQHWVDGLAYPIWSNSLGCFDTEHSTYDRYVYFAGDSFTWGYTPFEQKFGTLIEDSTGVPILKCAVGHTGQRHQYDKMIEVIAEVRTLPRAIFVFYAMNDVANDYAYPHSTVIEGWRVDSVRLDENGEVVKIAESELRKKLDRKLKRFAESAQIEKMRPIKRMLRQYSLSANMVISIVDGLKAKPMANGAPSHRAPLGAIDARRDVVDGIYWYRDNPRAQNNKNAILAFENFAAKNKIFLAFVLIPGKTGERFDVTFYAQLRNFLDSNAIRYIDLTTAFQERNLTPKELSWWHDSHLNPFGNRVTAEIVIGEFPKIFDSN